MQAGLDLFLIPLMVDFQQADQHLPSGHLANGVAHPPGRLVEVVVQAQVVPAIGDGHRVIHLHMQVLKAGGVGATVLLAARVLVEGPAVNADSGAPAAVLAAGDIPKGGFALRALLLLLLLLVVPDQIVQQPRCEVGMFPPQNRASTDHRVVSSLTLSE